MRGSQTAQSASTSYATLFDEASGDGTCSVAGFEYASGTDVIIVRWTSGQSRTNYLTLTSTSGWKCIKAPRGKISKIEFKSLAGTPSLHFDMIQDEAPGEL